MESVGNPLNSSNSRFFSLKHPLSDDDDIEEVVRQESTPIRDPTLCGYRPRSFRPVRRRRRLFGEFEGKKYETFDISTARSSMDGSDVSSSSAMTVVTSATSSCTDPWSSSGGFVEEEDDDGDFNWDQEDETLLEPKLEPTDSIDMADLAEIKGSVGPESPTSVTKPAQTKRPRGRPRKHPRPNPETMAKIAKGRSKTGCLTCRKRKKKCDETKPGCEFMSVFSRPF